jgi:anti-sigma factor RsiW
MTIRDMHCPLLAGETQEVLLDYAAGRLDRGRSASLEKHAESCPACAAWLAGQAALWSALDEWTPEPVSLDFNRQVWRRIEAAAAAPWYTRVADMFRFGGWKPAIPLAAAMLVVAAGFLLDHQGTGPAVPAGGAGASGGSSLMEVDQVERSLDDIQLLKQFDTSGGESAPSKVL